MTSASISRPIPRSTAIGASPMTAPSRPCSWTSTRTAGCSRAISSSSIPTISASTSNSPTSCSGCASSIRKSARSCCARARSGCSAPAPTSGCSAGAAHAHKVNFCKFTNETRNTFEAAGAESGQRYICAVKGACAGGGYELALACDHILLADDGAVRRAAGGAAARGAAGTGGLTRVTDKRKVRRDLADVFCSIEEGVKGKRAPNGGWSTRSCPIKIRRDGGGARAGIRGEGAPADAKGVALTPLERASARTARCLFAGRSADRPREGRRDDHVPGPTPTRPPPSRRCTRRARTGRCGSRANLTTRSCICASTNSSSA